ncbi:MAG: HPr kinase/phosphorylase [Oricola sp.]
MTGDGRPAGGSTLEHATVVEIDRRGVLIRGPSGSGKTALAIELLFRCRACDIESALVADDYVYLAGGEETGTLVASAPERTAGLIEFRGFGIVKAGYARHKPKTRVGLSVLLAAPADCDRVADPGRRAVFFGVALPELALPEREPISNAYAVLGCLGLSERVF